MYFLVVVAAFLVRFRPSPPSILSSIYLRLYFPAAIHCLFQEARIENRPSPPSPPSTGKPPRPAEASSLDSTDDHGCALSNQSCARGSIRPRNLTISRRHTA